MCMKHSSQFEMGTCAPMRALPNHMRWEATPEITLAECIVLNENPSITQINIAYEFKILHMLQFKFTANKNPK